MNDYRQHFLKLGELAISRRGTVITTLVGSCVSVCVYASKSKIGGMVHCSLPGVAEDAKSFLYSETAVTSLVNMLRKEISRPNDKLYAKIVGGANHHCLSSDIAVGESNVKSCKAILSKLGVELVSSETGGTSGRKVFFYSGSGRVRVATLDSTSNIHQKNQETQVVEHVKDIHGSKKALVQIENRTGVYIIDDSKSVQQVLVKALSSHPSIDVLGTASSPIEAMPALEKLKPDVITLDMNMPHMDGLSFVKHWLPKHPVPIVLISSVNLAEGNKVFEALEHGALDYVQKPAFSELADFSELIQEKVINAAKVPAYKIRGWASRNKARLNDKFEMSSNLLVAIGASTGGTEAIKRILTRLPERIPPIVIVQHIPPVFSKAFADRMNSDCSFEVKEAEDGDTLQEGSVLIAPGGKQMAITSQGERLVVKVNEDEPVNRHRPSVDYLFFSIAELKKRTIIGLILTGMGEDGAQGLLKMRENGAVTIAQNESSCVVFGMPRVAIEAGAAQYVEDLDNIPEQLVRLWTVDKSFKEIS